MANLASSDGASNEKRETHFNAVPPGTSNAGLTQTEKNAGTAPHAKIPELLNASWSHVQDSAKSLYRRTVVELLLRRNHVQYSGAGRRVPLRTEHQEPLIDPRRGHSYISNDIRTSRYTVWDFIPKQLFFQFTRVGNFYFLCVGIPQMVCIRPCNLAASAIPPVVREQWPCLRSVSTVLPLLTLSVRNCRFLACPPQVPTLPSFR